MSEPTLTRTEDGNFECPDDPGERGYKMLARRRSVTPEEAAILAELARGLTVLEIGTGLGVATRAMAETARRVVSVDVDPWCHEFQFPENVTLTSEVPSEPFDLAFIDGNHKYYSVRCDISAVNAPLIVLHDHYLPDVKRAVADAGLIIEEVYSTRCEMVRCRRAG